jgi:hypothetical protein
MQYSTTRINLTTWPIFLALLFVGIVSSCTDFIEKDISAETPVMIVPQIGDTIGEYTKFVWEEVPGATHYGLKIYSPSFSNPSFVAFDSIITQKSLFVNLEVNTYEYQLIAYNNGYSSKSLGPIAFVVDTLQNNVNQIEINLMSPSSTNYYNADFNGIFNWSNLSGISSYEFSLRKGTNYTTGTIVFSQNNITTASTSVTGVSYDEGIYVWGIRAYMTNGETTQVFTSTFQIDTIPPGTPSLVSPEDQSTVTSPVTFEWSLPADLGVVQSPIQSVLQISTSDTFTTIEHTETLSTNTAEVTLEAGTYYWRVYLIDAAGNIGEFYSTEREFTIN